MFKFNDVILIHRPGESIPIATEFGCMLTREQWLSMKAEIEAFYGNISDEQIEMFNFKSRWEQEVRSTGWSVNIGLRKPNPGYVYVIHDNGEYKIGMSASPDKRLKQVRKTEDAEIVLQMLVPDARLVESILHKHFQDKRIGGEWFSLDTQDIEYIRSVAREIYGQSTEVHHVD